MKKLVLAAFATVTLVGTMSAAQADIRTYRTACAACHAYGAPGPKVGDKVVWKDRIAKGMDTLYTNAIKGTDKGMPAKGGRMDLTDAQVKAIVDYMVKESK